MSTAFRYTHLLFQGHWAKLSRSVSWRHEQCQSWKGIFRVMGWALADLNTESGWALCQRVDWLVLIKGEMAGLRRKVAANIPDLIGAQHTFGYWLDTAAVSLCTAFKATTWLGHIPNPNLTFSPGQSWVSWFQPSKRHCCLEYKIW